MSMAKNVLSRVFVGLGAMAFCAMLCLCMAGNAYASEDSLVVYRLYNPGNSEHLYTTDANEYQVLAAQYGWKQEGSAWASPTSGTPVYRLYNADLDGHLYTTDTNEVSVLTAHYGWTKDYGGKPMYYSGGNIPVYRLYNESLRGQHHLTADTNEYSVLPQYGWKQEGVAFYSMPLSEKDIVGPGMQSELVSYRMTLDQMTDWCWPYSVNAATKADLRNMIDPKKQTGGAMYQFMDIRKLSGLTAAQINDYIALHGADGSLAGQGETILAACRKYGLNEVYFISHSIIETGWGKSALAKGYYYDGTVDVDGRKYPAGTYYNFFGIGAVDSGPLSGGRAMAIKNGWNSIPNAIMGSAKWIAENYTYRSQYPQVTLYEMKWDPERASATMQRGWHQYATASDWPAIVGNFMNNVYSRYGYPMGAGGSFRIPVYR